MARVGRAVVGADALADLGNEALGEIAQALDLDAVAMYVAGTTAARTLDQCAQWRRNAHSASSAGTVVLTADEWQLLAATSGPVLFRGKASLIANPFTPAAGSWLVLPLVSQKSLKGMVVGCARVELSLDPVTTATLHSIAALLGAGVTTALLRGEFQRFEIQRERMRLATELHEGLAQHLALAVRELAFLASRPDEGAAQGSRDRLATSVNEAHRVVRAGLEDLVGGQVPTGGLEATIQQVAERFRRRGMTVDVRLEPLAIPIPAHVIAAMLRVVHEALANVQRHAGVSVAEVSLVQKDNHIRLIIADNGRGCNPEELGIPGAGQFGVSLMRERALAAGGRLAIDSSSGEGVRVMLLIPLDNVG
ncbi:hypothetical protein BH23CHL7_BH23CHL7_10470 [soil metagenome]